MSISELIDLYGRHGFDVLAVTDHVARAADPAPSVSADRWYAYVHELERAAQRARRRYGLLVIPGAELTDNDADQDRAAHALALGLRRLVCLEEGIVGAIQAARADGAVIAAAHPYGPHDATPLRPTRRFALEHELFRPLVHRWELFNRREVFGWVAEAGLPVIASGDVHRAQELSSWKTLLPCDHDEESVLAYLCSEERAYLAPFSADSSERVPVAA
jgi:predicted metal-dependent phosphoesterase TrpH